MEGVWRVMKGFCFGFGLGNFILGCLLRDPYRVTLGLGFIGIAYYFHKQAKV